MVEGSFVVTLGVGEQWLVEELSDGRYRVTRGTTSRAGADFGVGLTAQVVIDDNPYGGSLAADAGGRVTFTGGEVYYAEDQDGVDQLFEQHKNDVVMDHLVAPGGVVRDIGDWVHSRFVDDTELPESSETYTEGGLEGTAGARATLLASGASAELGSTQILGVRTGRDGTTTEYLQSTVTGQIGASTWSGGDETDARYSEISAAASFQTIIEIERDGDGEVTSVSTRMVLAGESAATNTQGTEVSGPSRNGYVERTITLPIRNDADRELATRYLRSIGVQEVAGLPVQIPITALAGDGPGGVLAFAEATRDRGYVTEQSFDNDTRTDGAALGGELIGKAGAAGEVSQFTRTSTAGSYFDGTTWQPWRACG